MAFQAEETHAGTDVKPFWKQYRLFHAAAAQCTSPILTLHNQHTH